MIDNYFSENGEAITDPSHMRKGDLCVVTYAKGYRGFIMPGQDRISQNGHLRLVGVTVYETIDVEKKGKIRFLNLDLDEGDFEHPLAEIGIFRAKEGSDLRKTLVDNLGKIIPSLTQ